MSFQNDAIFWVDVHKISPNPYQPRREFDLTRLKELSESIRQYGVLQPLVVTRKEVPKDDGGISVEYELIAGERRLRASRLADISQVPVIIRDGAESDRMKLELAIIENLQREDLSSVDRAHAFKQLTEEFGMSHVQVAQKMGRSREYVSNTLRLLLLPEDLLLGLQQGSMTEGHARTLLMLNDRPEEQKVLYREILLKKLSVREVERITRSIATEKVKKNHWLGADLEIMAMEKRFTDALGTRVQIAKTDFGGKLVIDYFSPEDLQKLLHMMTESEVRVTTPKEPAPVLESEPSAQERSADVTAASAADTAPISEMSAEIVAESEEIAQEAPAPAADISLDDRAPLEKKSDDDTDLYAIKNFSL